MKMLDRAVVAEFLDGELKEWRIKVPRGVRRKDLVETFCLYVEDDYYEWLKDNFKSFFGHGDPCWDWIKERMNHYKSCR
jgi:hypothetical protein